MKLLNRHIPHDPLAFIRSCLKLGQVRWTYHASMRIQQRSISTDVLLIGVESLEIIEEYPSDKYLPSFLLRFEFGREVFHAQIATDVVGWNIRIVTMYDPDAEEWDHELRARRLR